VKKKETERKAIYQQVLAEMKAEFEEKQRKAHEIINKRTSS
jgi:hypothetical protein